MVDRTADNAWAEIQDICRKAMLTNTPIRTLIDTKTENSIVRVTENAIFRKSTRGGATPSRVSKKAVTEIWNSLLEKGEAQFKTATFALALVHQIPGIGHRSGPSRLFIENSDLAMRVFVPTASSSADDNDTGESSNDGENDAQGPSTDREVGLAELMRQTYWSREELEDILETLQTRRPQIIFAGPPGTGKTWIAEQIGRYLTQGRKDAVHLVQFHPSYAYEDFVEGLRPIAKDGQVVFESVKGPLIEIAEKTKQQSIVLVIDEMNRANLPSVFGEMLYLLEYRGKAIQLLHRKNFHLPKNLLIIGTMNTADRSIRSVDTALRRRFDIFDCEPRPEILDAFYSEEGNHTSVAGLADGLSKLNAMLIKHLDRHHTVGHSFFMAKNFTRKDLERTWKRQIKPLIDEYFFDQPDLASQFQLEAFWPGGVDS